MFVAGDTTTVNYFDKAFDRSQVSAVELAPVIRQHAACSMYITTILHKDGAQIYFSLKSWCL